jgi:hypothetical protein
MGVAPGRRGWAAALGRIPALWESRSAAGPSSTAVTPTYIHTVSCTPNQESLRGPHSVEAGHDPDDDGDVYRWLNCIGHAP